MFKDRINIFFVIVLFGLSNLVAQTNDFTLFSPDSLTKVKLFKSVGKWMYNIQYNEKEAILNSSFDIQLNNEFSEWALGIKDKPEGGWMKGLELINISKDSVSSDWKPIFGEKKVIPNSYNSVTLHFKQKASDNYKMDIEIRAFNEGIAFRYFFHTNPTGIYYRVMEENTEFTLPEETLAWYEQWAQGPYVKSSLSNWPAQSERPLTLELKNGNYLTLAEAGVLDYVRTKFKLSESKKNTIQTAMHNSVDMIPYFSTPWRVVMVADSPGKLIENNHILLNLNESSKIKDTSWIKPGKIVRDLTLSEKGAKDWIDFAATHNLQYVLFDWKWYGPAFTWDSDASTVDTSKMKMNLQEVINYGKQKNIGVWLYVNQQALKKQDAEIFSKYKDWGVVGVKYGFVQVGSRYWTNWLHESIQRAADNQLMVNIHDEFRTTGEERTWPNILTVEGIRGNEEMPNATHNTILPFTRGLAGMGDYTICYYSNRIKTTHAHQLALSVIMYSPLQTLFWYDKAEDYKGEPEIEFFENVPTVWDATKVIDGKPGEFIITARKSKSNWFIGGITNNDARTVSISLDFLEEGKKYEAKLYYDNDKIKTRTKVGVKNIKVGKKDNMKMQLKPSGGFALHIKEIN